MPFAKSNGISLYYEIRGDHGSPLVMIHGYAMSHVGWRTETIQLLSTAHQVILFDNRGSGRSDCPATPYRLADLAADTVGLLDCLGIDRSHILGASMGGMIAQHIAINYPARVSSLILACTAASSPTHPFILPAPEALAQLTKPPSADLAQDIRDSWPLSYTANFITSGRAVLEQILQAHLAYPATSTESLQRQFEAVMNTHDSYERLAQIICPTLIQVGTEDLLIPVENSRVLAKLIPQARLIEYVGYGHGFLEENGVQAAQDILTFLEEVDLR